MAGAAGTNDSWRAPNDDLASVESAMFGVRIVGRGGQGAFRAARSRRTASSGMRSVLGVDGKRTHGGAFEQGAEERQSRGDGFPRMLGLTEPDPEEGPTGPLDDPAQHEGPLPDWRRLYDVAQATS